jgi:hypothetical protein
MAAVAAPVSASREPSAEPPTVVRALTRACATSHQVHGSSSEDELWLWLKSTFWNQKKILPSKKKTESPCPFE